MLHDLMLILAYLVAALVAMALPFALARVVLRRHAAQRRYEDDLMDGR